MKRVLVDETCCTGCRYCEVVCSLKHEGETNPRKSRIRILGDPLNGEDRPTVCDPYICKTMPCVDACPVSAIKKDPDTGYPLISIDECTGCKICLEACPINAIFYDQEKRKALKCDLCGGDPECVKRCVAHVYLPHIPLQVLKYE
ncbi:MAG: 4Fe-4S dicluster domain-containing protein [Candidatus Bathyarchaeia archaeon]